MREKGTASYSGNFEVQKAAPLDARGKTATVADLILASTWTANDGLIYVFKGLSTVVTDDPTPSKNGIWWLSALPYTTAANWKQIAGSSGSPITFGTFSEIKALAIANSLVLNQLYVITDFITKYKQFGTGTIMTGDPETLVLTAKASNSFHTEVKSLTSPFDEIHYNINGTKNYYNEPTPLVANKGVITWRKDFHRNSADYDHKTILWKRNAIDVFTFESGCHDNEIEFNSISGNIGSYDNVFGNNSAYNKIGLGSSGNTFGLDCMYNVTGNTFNSNTIGDYSSNNTFGGDNNNNVIGINFYSNTIGNGFSGNIIGDNANNNTISNGFINNVIGNNFYSNTIGNGFNSNTIGDSFGYNTIGDSFGSNTIGNDFQNNEIKNNISGTDWLNAVPTPIHVYQAYDCKIFKNSVLVDRLSYYNENDELIITNITA